jgi:hypothetical protein
VIIGLPGNNPVTTPVVPPTVASDELLLLQLPPGTASVSVVVVPIQITGEPDIGAGLALTVTVVVA